MTTKLMPTHLNPLATAFDTALREGAVNYEDVEEFIGKIHDSVLEHRVNKGLKTRAKYEVENEQPRTKAAME